MENRVFIEACIRLIQHPNFDSIKRMDYGAMEGLAREISRQESGSLYDEMLERIQTISKQREEGREKLIDSLSQNYSDYDFNNLPDGYLKMLLNEPKVFKNNNIPMELFIKILTLEELVLLNKAKKSTVLQESKVGGKKSRRHKSRKRKSKKRKSKKSRMGRFPHRKSRR